MTAPRFIPLAILIAATSATPAAAQSNSATIYRDSNFRGSAVATVDQTNPDLRRTFGWNGSAHEMVETVSRRIHLADVLCVRSGY